MDIVSIVTAYAIGFITAAVVLDNKRDVGTVTIGIILIGLAGLGLSTLIKYIIGLF